MEEKTFIKQLMEGSEEIDKLVISYPRSGLNWLRYCTEFLTKKPTPGTLKGVEGVEGIFPATFHRSHFINSRISFPFSRLPRELHEYRKVLLILRNYKEGFVRCREVPRAFDKSPLLRLQTYARNVVGFDALECEKHVLYYEDMVCDFAYMVQALEFLEVPMTHLPQLTGDLREHKNRSIGMYKDRSYTKGKPKHVLYHSKKLDANARLLIDRIMRKETGATFDVYLKRYEDGGGLDLQNLDSKDPDIRLLMEQAR